MIAGRRGPTTARRAYTLLELCLALAVLLAIGALVWPALDKPIAADRLRYSGEQVRAELTRGRVAAMQTGRVHCFQLNPTSGQFSIAPLTDVAAATTGNAQTSGVAVAAHTLPEGVSIFHVATIDDATPPPAGSAASGAGGGQSSTIYFHPDGTASSAEITLVNQHQAFVRVELRGLTGATAVSELLAPEEVQ